MVTTKLNLSMTEPQVRQIYAKQGDTGRVLDISLDQTPEDGTLRILRPDGTEVTSEAVTGGEVSESGETVTFDSLTEADVTELTVGIEPVQDLNGYDAPWVGGAGKNLLNYDMWKTVSIVRGTAVWENNGVTLTATDNDCFTSYYGSSFPNDAKIEVSEGETITIAWDATPTDVGIVIIFPNAQTSGMVVAASNTGHLSYTVASGVTFIIFRVGVSNSGVTVSYKNIQIVRGTTVPTWQPYSNICPITGHDEVRVTRTGINVWDEEWEGGTINTSTGVNSDVGLNTNIRSTNFIPVLASAEYYFCRQNFAGNIFEYDNSKNFIRVVPSPITFTTTANTGFLRFYMGTAYGNTYNHDISINYPSTDHDYHAYQGSTYTTSLGQTVYGGTLDMVSGVLTVDRAIVTLNGSETWNTWREVAYYTNVGSLVGGAGYPVEMMSNSFRWIGRINDPPSNVELGDFLSNAASVGGNWNGNVSFFYDNLVGGLNNFKAWVASNPIQIVYTLNTPQTYQLTAQQIKTLVGTNNVWASSGDIVNITFTYGGLLSELPSDATEIVGKCYCDIEQNGVSSMPFTLNVKKNERES